MEKCASVQRLVESQPDKLELTMENDGLVRVTGLDDRFTTNEVSQMLSTRFKLANTEKVLQSLEAAKFASITNPTENVPITKTANTAVIVDMYEVDYTPATLGESTQAIEKSFDAINDFVSRYTFPDTETKDVIVGPRSEVYKQKKIEQKNPGHEFTPAAYDKPSQLKSGGIKGIWKRIGNYFGTRPQQEWTKENMDAYLKHLQQTLPKPNHLGMFVDALSDHFNLSPEYCKKYVDDWYFGLQTSAHMDFEEEKEEAPIVQIVNAPKGDGKVKVKVKESKGNWKSELLAVANMVQPPQQQAPVQNQQQTQAPVPGQQSDGSFQYALPTSSIVIIPRTSNIVVNTWLRGDVNNQQVIAHALQQAAADAMNAIGMYGRYVGIRPQLTGRTGYRIMQNYVTVSFSMAGGQQQAKSVWRELTKIAMYATECPKCGSKHIKSYEAKHILLTDPKYMQCLDCGNMWYASKLNAENNGWISVKDSLPEIDKYVDIIAYNTRHPDFKWTGKQWENDNGKGFMEEPNVIPLKDVTYWKYVVKDWL